MGEMQIPGGNLQILNFHFQSMARARPAKYVWYVNGYLADIFLKRGVTYTFM